jgi:glycerol-3-phosphate dehydrogenase
MAKDAVDAAVDALDGKIPESTTMDIALVGAEVYQAAWNRRKRIAADTGLHVARIEHFLNRYGTMTEDILALIAEDPSLADPLPGADDYVGAEVVYAASHEGALHLEDVLARRTRISIEAWDRGVSAAPVAARLMAGVLGWDAEREEREVQTYLKRVAAERASQQQPDDESADRVRLEAPDIVDADAAALRETRTATPRTGAPSLADANASEVTGAGAEDAPSTDG